MSSLEDRRSVEGVATAPQEAPGPLRTGALAGGRYQLGERIGAGGMATIYRGFDRTLERQVAIKVLHTHLADDPELQERFRTEALHAAALSHPHIVTVFDQGVADLPYIVMELVDGPSLREVLREHGRLSAPAALTVLEPVARALARAHRAGVVHRDIKPENVLIAADGTPKVADFGIARVVAGTSHTQTGALIGSVHYLAPELVDGHEAGRASDQYATGVVLYELLTGKRPFAGDSPMAVALRHTRDRVPAPSSQGADCPDAVDAVVARATAHDPAARYPDMDAFADALRAAVPEGPAAVPVTPDDDDATLVIGERPDDRPAPDHTPTPALPAGGPPRRRARRIRRVVLTAVLTLAILAAAAGGALAWWHFLVAPMTPVPALVGLTEEAAFAEVDALGLGFTVDSRRHDFDVPEGEVLAQEPPRDTEVRRGDDVSVVLSLGPEPVDMPAVLGLEEAAALAELEDERLAVTVEEAHDDHVPAGAVLAQEPEAGTPLRQGDAVAVTVSLGIEQVEVPTLVGRQADEVETIVEDSALTMGTVHRAWSDEVPTEGEVISQSLGQGTTVDKGSAVEVTVSLGPLTIELPDVRGDAVGDARELLEARSLEVEVVTEPRPRLGPFVRGSVGLVEEQLPAAGEPIQRGETVTLYTYAD